MLAYLVELMVHFQSSNRASPQNTLSGQRPFIAEGARFDAKPKYNSLNRLEASTSALLSTAGPCIDGGYILAKALFELR